MNDRIKHRIVGVVIVAAFLVVLMPALIKHENPDDKKPHYAPNERPVTAMVEPVSSASVEAEMYQTNQVAQVSLDEASPNTESTQPLAESNRANEPQEAIKPTDSIESMDSSVMETNPTTPITPASQDRAQETKEIPVNAQSISSSATSPTTVQKAPKTAVLPQQKNVVKKTVVVPAIPAPVQPKNLVKNTPKLETICFQLGTFSNLNNASLLVQKLKAKGFVTAKKTSVVLANGKRVEKVSYCKAMPSAEISSMRAKLTLIAGTNPFITR